MHIKPQTIVLRGGLRLVIRETSIDIMDGAKVQRLHVTPAGDVLRITTPLTSEVQKAMG